jgi:UDPglucose 6-dehydrogenase
MRVTILGLWHLGCVYAAGSAALGHQVTAWDHDPNIVKNLSAGKPPLFEPGLPEQIESGLAAGSLIFETDLKTALAGAEIIWLAYDTPVDGHDRADADFVIGKAARALPLMPRGAVMLVSSQLPAGSVAKMETMAKDMGRDDLEFACSPENLRLGQALYVFANPDRIVCGVRSESAMNKLEALFGPIKAPVEWMSVESAEMTKHAINAFLAMSVAFANEIAVICETVGADAKEVERGLKTETRIGRQAYVGPGLAFAGGTLARDLAFLTSFADNNQSPLLLVAARKSNDRHKMWVVNKLQARLGDLRGRTIALWGLAYKPGTDTLRRSSAIECAKHLAGQGAMVKAHDPAISQLPDEYRPVLSLAKTPLEAAARADALVVCTTWPDYRRIRASEIIEAMNYPLLLDPTRFLFETLGEIQTLDYVAIGFNSKIRG